MHLKASRKAITAALAVAAAIGAIVVIAYCRRRKRPAVLIDPCSGDSSLRYLIVDSREKRRRRGRRRGQARNKVNTLGLVAQTTTLFATHHFISAIAIVSALAAAVDRNSSKSVAAARFSLHVHVRVDDVVNVDARGCLSSSRQFPFAFVYFFFVVVPVP